jgi:hypothetical protein
MAEPGLQVFAGFQLEDYEVAQPSNDGVVHLALPSSPQMPCSAGVMLVCPEPQPSRALAIDYSRSGGAVGHPQVSRIRGPPGDIAS